MIGNVVLDCEKKLASLESKRDFGFGPEVVIVSQGNAQFEVGEIDGDAVQCGTGGGDGQWCQRRQAVIARPRAARQ